MRQGAYQRKLSIGEVRLMKEFYWEGWNMRQLADHFGVSRQAIWQLLHRRGVDIRPRHPKHPNGTNGKGLRQARDDAGCILTVKHQTTGKIGSFHEPGPFALEHACERIDASGEEWKIICYSSPQTMTRDLEGVRSNAHPGSSTVDSPEIKALAQIGRLDLLDPTLQITDPRTYRRRKK